jgi:hypothetical protein
LLLDGEETYEEGDSCVGDEKEGAGELSVTGDFGVTVTGCGAGVDAFVTGACLSAKIF